MLIWRNCRLGNVYKINLIGEQWIPMKSTVQAIHLSWLHRWHRHEELLCWATNCKLCVMAVMHTPQHVLFQTIANQVWWRRWRSIAYSVNNALPCSVISCYTGFAVLCCYLTIAEHGINGLLLINQLFSIINCNNVYARSSWLPVIQTDTFVCSHAMVIHYV